MNSGARTMSNYRHQLPQMSGDIFITDGGSQNGNPNVLTPDKGTSQLGQGPIVHSCLVAVEKYGEELIKQK